MHEDFVLTETYINRGMINNGLAKYQISQVVINNRKKSKAR